MSVALDHLVLGVRDLDRSVREFRAAGFDVSEGVHTSPIVSARVLLDGSYVELVSFGTTRSGSATRLLSRTPIRPALLFGGNESGGSLSDSTGFMAAVVRVGDRCVRIDATDPAQPTTVQRSPNEPTIATKACVAAVTVTVTDLDRAADRYRAMLGDPIAPRRWQLGDTVLVLESGSAPRIRVHLKSERLPLSAVTMDLTSTADDPGDDAVARLSAAVQIRTVSYDDRTTIDDAEFVELGMLIEKSFPRVHSELTLEKFAHSRLYTWHGRDRDRVGALFLAHLDVVPVDDAELWTHPPFAGVIDDEFIWGRGTIDDKSRAFALLEAVEASLADGFTPATTLMFALGHDEEIGGDRGAAVIAEQLRSRGVRAELLLDEGGVITTGIVDDVDRPVASIMVGEKGFVTIRLSTTDPGGHSSMPGKETAVGRIARAVAALQDHQLPIRVIPAVVDMVKLLAPFMSEPKRTVLGLGTKALPAVIARILTARPSTGALVRTTTAPTVIRGGVKDNVLPQLAEALVNFRILPGETIADVEAHCRKVIDDKLVKLETMQNMLAEPSPVTASDSPEFAFIADTVRTLVPDVAVTTGLVPGATDSRHYNDVFAARFNFAPIVFEQADIDRIHGFDERLSRINYGRLIRFDRLLFEKLGSS
ncbi:M20/M25/M40 family metallo-hydrolase [Antrihabitans cavernicola]|uniref:M20/M25/M40 family metallo-hydrolase n=1 Tax=Antrihabitans cavernicola TaxID=2495913 RepID=UPI001659F41C|nr:M20/M25/M40 family metallo-hydrolase [Spelaeibacter cavernicola]